jgi:nicotinamidase-related amidase
MTDFMVGKPALVVVDMQVGGDDSGIPFMGGYDDHVERATAMIDAARRNDIPVIFIQEVHRPDHVDFGRELDGTEDVHCLEGHASTAIDERLGMRPNDYHIVKRRYSAFFGTDLEILLKGLKAETLVLCGGLTDVCVHYTFVDAHQHDYHARVVEDACGGSTLARHEASLDAMEYLQTGARCTHESVITAFDALGGHQQRAIAS